ncbi:unnamed protein product [Rotaria magnacalcarata]|uniref:Uncharacterized protein n=1 Tax=Rotaria magnacalcarata TaxID=392030 RepID=A0A815B054_9BILA|nr:unnamed protein product [Rotaria magnacalcarata]
MKCFSVWHCNRGLLANEGNSNNEFCFCPFYLLNRESFEIVNSLQHIMMPNQKFESLSLRGNKSSLCTLVEIFLTAPRDQVLTELNLAEKCIGDEEVQFIVDALRNNTTIININLAKKNIGVDGTKYMSDLLQNDKTLLTLNLQSTKIGDEGTKYLANGLRKNTTLQTLDLRENNIGPLGAQYLADALRENTVCLAGILFCIYDFFSNISTGTCEIDSSR